MNGYIPTPTVGEIIIEEFMNPLNISVAMLFKNLGLSEEKTRALLDGEAKVTLEISKRLSEYFGMSELFFFKLQKDIDNRNAKMGFINNAVYGDIRELAFA